MHLLKDSRRNKFHLLGPQPQLGGGRVSATFFLLILVSALGKSWIIWVSNTVKSGWNSSIRLCLRIWRLKIVPPASPKHEKCVVFFFFHFDSSSPLMIKMVKTHYQNKLRHFCRCWKSSFRTKKMPYTIPAWLQVNWFYYWRRWSSISLGWNGIFYRWAIVLIN